jgi:hypothetical protein
VGRTRSLRCVGEAAPNRGRPPVLGVDVPSNPLFSCSSRSQSFPACSTKLTGHGDVRHRALPQEWFMPRRRAARSETFGGLVGGASESGIGDPLGITHAQCAEASCRSAVWDSYLVLAARTRGPGTHRSCDQRWHVPKRNRGGPEMFPPVGTGQSSVCGRARLAQVATVWRLYGAIRQSR